MTVNFVITIDTEIDRSFDWSVSRKETFLSVVDGIPNLLTPLFNRLKVKPTYLLSSEVIENDNCVQILKNIDNCEFGAHLHGDLIKPQKKFNQLGGTYNHAMQNTYPKETEYKKLRNLTELFKAKFGYPPISFRAGRFAAGTNTINSLEKLGYLVDSSVTPGIYWNYPEGRANFLNAPNQPYFPSRENILKEGDSKILEVPISINSSKFKSILNRTKIFGRNRYIDGVINKIFPTYWLRPSFQSSEEMIHVVKEFIKQNKKMENVVLNMMFHSMEIVPNASPYTKTENDCKDFMTRIEEVLKFGEKNNFQSKTLSELYPFYKEQYV